LINEIRSGLLDNNPLLPGYIFRKSNINLTEIIREKKKMNFIRFSANKLRSLFDFTIGCTKKNREHRTNELITSLKVSRYSLFDRKNEIISIVVRRIGK
jgi:hypothetical protein